MGAPIPDPAARTEADARPGDAKAAEPRGSDAPAPSMAGQTIAGRFRLVRLIGRGGMGEVHEAEHIELARRVAVKIMHARAAMNRTSITRIKREARSLAALSHPNVVQVLDAGEHEGWPYIAMELLHGEDLRTRLDREGPLPVGEAIAITSQILAGLDAVHAAGVVHRDVKPENIFLTKAPDGTTFVKILDFGVSKLMAIDSSAGNLTESGTIVGSPAFMAPEQAIGSAGVDARTDLYSVGALLYTMLAGRAPFAAPNIPAVLLAIVEGRSEPLANVRPGLPTALLQLIERAMDKERGKRFKGAAEFSAALQAVAPTGVLVAEVRRRGLSRFFPHLAVGAVLVAVLGGFAATRQGGHGAGQRLAKRPQERAMVVEPEPEVAPPSKKAPQAPRRAHLRVDIHPPRAAASARVSLDGRLLAGTDVEVPASDAPSELRVEADGFASFEVSLPAVRGEVNVPVRLRPLGAKQGVDGVWRPMGIEKTGPFR
jgi:serine/threonine-protein kinase